MNTQTHTVNDTGTVNGVHLETLQGTVQAIAQDPALGETLYHAAVKKLGWSDPSKAVRPPGDPRYLALTVALAREYGDDVTFNRLSDFAEQNYEPRQFGPTNDEFGWWFQFGEDWPRGQLSALLAMGEVGTPGAWKKLFREPNLEKFGQPTVTDVDFPTLGIGRAWTVYHTVQEWVTIRGIPAGHRRRRPSGHGKAHSVQ